MNADQIGVALKGRRNGNGWLVSCPCPNHGKGRGDRSPSLSVSDGDDGRLLLCCFAGCQFDDILDELRHRGLVNNDRQEPRERLIRETPHVPNADAVTIWKAAEPLPHTIAAEYLDRRGITLRPPSLRCRIERPALIAGVQDPDGKIIAIQQTSLTRNGGKVSSQPRMTLGGLGAGAIRLGAAARVMGLAEGTETALSAMQMTSMTVWASLGAQRLDKVWLPPIVETVHLFGDNDNAGREAVERATHVHISEGRAVVPRFPPDRCGDYNDLLISIADRDGRDLLTAEDAA
jgi:putative DNA primase/helicase